MALLFQLGVNFICASKLIRSGSEIAFGSNLRREPINKAVRNLVLMEREQLCMNTKE